MPDAQMDPAEGRVLGSPARAVRRLAARRVRSAGGSDAPTDRPKWLVVAATEIAVGSVFTQVMSPRTALYWYVFPLFGLGACYLVQFRAELPTRWKVAFAGSAVLSAVALRLDWPFSGHILWNVLFIGHAAMATQRRTAWTALMLASLTHLVVVKAATQTSRDVFGGVLSAALAAGAVLVLRRGDHLDDVPEPAAGAE